MAPVTDVGPVVMLAGTVTAGAVVSSTVMVNDALLRFVAASVAEQWTVVAPSGNVSPLAASQIGVTEPSTRSDAETVNVTAAPDGPVASAVMSAGMLMSGPVVSTTVTLN